MSRHNLDETATGGRTYYYWIAWETTDGTLGPVVSTSGAMPSLDPADEIARISAEILADPFAQELMQPVAPIAGTISTDSVVGWGIWGTDADGFTLFSATITALRSSDFYFSSVTGVRAFSNPVSGSAAWAGAVRGITEDFDRVQGSARIEYDFTLEHVDVLFGRFDDGRANMGWNGLDVRLGGFRSGSEIEGTFYGANHEGIAGKFDRDGLKGVFGVARQ